MAWSYDHKTRLATDGREGIIPRVRVEEAAEALYRSGLTNRLQLVDCLKALSGLSRAEIRSIVDLVTWNLMYGEFLEPQKGASK